MFAKLKEKITESKIAALAESVISPNSSSVIDPSLSLDDHFTIDEDAAAVPNSPSSRLGFSSVDLGVREGFLPRPPTSKSRRSSTSSVLSDAAGSTFHPQSDLESASEFEDSFGPHTAVGGDQLPLALKRAQLGYNKYKGRYADLVRHYRDMERENSKTKRVLAESQDRSLRREAELKEQCALEQRAKAHLEEILRNDLEEKDHLINTLQTKIRLLKPHEAESSDLVKWEGPETVFKDNWPMSPPNHPSDSGEPNVVGSSPGVDGVDLLTFTDSAELDQLRSRCEALEEQNRSLVLDKKNLEVRLQTIEVNSRTQIDELVKNLQEAKDTIGQLTKREEEASISSAETKQALHIELESKELQVKELNKVVSTIQEEKAAQCEKLQQELLKFQLQDNLNAECAKNLDTKNKTMAASVDLLNIEIEDLTIAKTKLAEELALVNGKCLHLENRVHKRDTQLAAEARPNAEVTETISDRNRTKQEVEEEIQREWELLTASMRALEIEAAAKESRIRELETTVCTLEAEREVHRTNLQRLEHEHAEHVKESDAKQREFALKIIDLNSIVKELSMSRMSCDEELAQTHVLGKTMTEDNKKLKALLLAQARAYAEMNKTMAQLNRTKEEVTENMKQRWESAQAFEIEAAAKENRIRELEDTVCTLKTEREAHLEDKSNMTLKFEQLQEQQNQCNKDFNDYKDTMLAHIKCLEVQKEVWQDKDAEIKQLLDANSLLAQNKCEMEQAFNAMLNKQANDFLENHLETAEAKNSLNDVILVLQKLNLSLDKKNRSLLEENASLLSRLTHVEDEIERMKMASANGIKHPHKDTRSQVQVSCDQIENSYTSRVLQSQGADPSEDSVFTACPTTAFEADEPRLADESATDRASLEAELQAVSQKNRELTTEIESKTESYGMLMNELEEAKTNNSDLKKKLAEFCNIKSSEMTAQEKERRDTDVKESEMGEHVTDKHDLMTALLEKDSLIQELHESHRVKIKQLATEFEVELDKRVNEATQSLKCEFDEQGMDINDRLTQMKNQTKMLKLIVEQSEKSVADLQERLHETKETKEREISLLQEELAKCQVNREIEIRDCTKKWRQYSDQELESLKEHHKEEIKALSEEWDWERKSHISSDPNQPTTHQELETTNRVAVAAVESGTGTIEILHRQLVNKEQELEDVLTQHKFEVTSLRSSLSSHTDGEDTTKMEYLRNILFKFMMGHEPNTLARVLADLVKFNEEQTSKVLQKTKQNQSVLGQLGLI